MGFLTELRSRGTAADYQALVDRTPYARLLGLSIDSIDEGGRLLTRLRFDPSIVGNPNLPAIHGGVIGAFLEMAAIFQLMSEGEGDRVPKPINFTVEYLRSAGPRDAFAQATITKLGRRVANVSVRAWQDDSDRPVAAAHGHFLMPQASWAGIRARQRAAGFAARPMANPDPAWQRNGSRRTPPIW
jgi:acyl-coenzyme A thioesterase PaaI-like protein